MTEERLVTEVPSSLKQLARLVVRGFYGVEDVLIIDMLVRNPCMKEDDMCELLKFERKMLRARIATLKGDKFLQIRLRMETGMDGKAQKVNYYFINYKSFVNVVKYKLDMMRKRLETEERDATSRASFKCPNCLKTFTDLEADQLFDFITSEFRCTYCGDVVEEDQSALPKKDSRLMLAKFNEQLDQLYILLREVEGIKLAPEVLEPEPVDMSALRGLDRRLNNGPLDAWSGDATRNSGFSSEETRVDISIGDGSSFAAAASTRKEAPIWMMESTIGDSTPAASDLHSSTSGPSRSTMESVDSDNLMFEAAAANVSTSGASKSDDIMSVLLAHEKKPSSAGAAQALQGNAGLSDASDDEENVASILTRNEEAQVSDNVDEMDDDDDDDDITDMPVITVGVKTYRLTDINDAIIAEMTPSEKDTYVQIFQDYYSHMNY